MQNRSIHQVLHVTGGTFIGFGLLFIVANKMEFGRSIIPHTVHSVVGSIALILIVVQIFVGMLRLFT